MEPEHQFGALTRQQWELVVFDRAVTAGYFTVVRFLGMGRYERHEYANFAAALADARQGGQGMVYAVAPSGRSVHLEVARWAELAGRCLIQPADKTFDIVVKLDGNLRLSRLKCL